MFKLVLDKSHLPLYKDFFPESSPENLSGMLYRFLQSFSRPIVSSIFGEQFIPIKMLVSIRTDRTNELIVPDNGKFYTDCTSEYPNEHPLDDTVLLATKSMVDKYFDCGEDLIKVIPCTVPLPIGACLRNDIIYVYITLVVDHKLKSEEYFKLKGCHYVNISDLTPSNDLESELIDSLAIVCNMQSEEVESNVSDDNQG